jgi:hypothetical protein
MAKRYFLKHYEDSVWKWFLEVKKEDIEKIIPLAGTVHVAKDDIENIEQYRIENEFSDQIMDAKDAENYVFLDIDELTHDERLYLFEGEYTYLSDLNAVEDVDLDELTDEQYTDLAIEIFSKLEEDIIGKMQKNGIDGKDIETQEIYRIWDGGNWRTYYLFDDIVEVTEELEGMEEIDFKREKYGQYHLYRLKDGRRMIEYYSCWQGYGAEICIVDKEVDTVEDALKVVREKDRRLFPEKYMEI